MTGNRTTELLPCPFCGGKAEIHPSNDWDAKFTGSTYFAWCDECETRGDYYNTEAEAIAAWNQRYVETCENMREKFGYKRLFVCSECGVTFDPDCEINYCPWCGREVVDNAD